MYQKRSYGVMPRTFGGLLEEVFNSNWNRMAEESIPYNVPVNIKETEAGYELHVLAPGSKKEDFKISVDKNILNVSYDHKEEVQEANGSKWLRTEFKHRSFKRSFSLNDNIDTTNVSAKYADGVLQIVLQKKQEVEPTIKEVAIN